MSSRRGFLAQVGAGVLAGVGRTRAVDAQRPNVLLIFTDDQRYDTIAALGNPQIQTPQLDRLAARGTAFTHAFIQGGTSGAVCVASRMMLMTGRWIGHCREHLPDEPLWPATFAAAGYDTWMCGKWHNGAPSLARAFRGGGPVFLGGMGRADRLPVTDFAPDGKFAKGRPAEAHATDLFCDATVDYLRRRPADKPFFAYCALTAPHDPRLAPEAVRNLYDPAKLDLGASFLPEHPFDNGELRIRDELLAPFPRTAPVIREHLRDYYACISYLDRGVGRILDALDASGQADRTLVIFTGDNGLALGRHGLMGKQNLYDHSVRVPLLIAGPGVAKGARCSALAYLNDLFATTCAQAGLATPAGVDGASLAPLLRDAGAKVRDSVFLAYRDFMRGVRTERHKLVLLNVKGTLTTQLFDLREDPWELRNLAAEQPARVKELTALLVDWQRRAGDTLDLSQPDWGRRGGKQA